MIHEALVVLHGGHGQVPFLEYLSRVLVHLLAFAAVAVCARWCVEVFEAITAGSVTEGDADGDGR